MNRTASVYVYHADTMVILGIIKHFEGEKAAQEHAEEIYGDDCEYGFTTNKYDALIDNGDWEYHEVADENGNI